MTARLPDNEVERLVALYEHAILDSEPTQEFDDLVRLAAHVCGVPIAAVTLIDAHRQWFKALFGLDVRETPRGMSFCAHTILEPDVLVIQDAQADSRFVENPLVTGEPNVRFYAGVPLVTEEGYALGSLCIIDKKPRRLTPDQVETLRLLGRQAAGLLRAARQVARQQSVVAESELLLLERELAERDQLRLAAIVESADEAIIAATLDGTIVSWNLGAERLYGYTAAEIIGQHMSVLAPASEKNLGREVAARLVRGDVLEPMEVVRTRKDGTRVDVLLSFSPIRDTEGIVVGGSCVARDITEQKRVEAALAETNRRLLESEARLRRFSDAAFEGIVVCQDGALVDVNPAFLAMYGCREPDEMIGRAPWQLAAPESRALVLQKVTDRDEAPYEAVCLRPDGSTFIGELRGRQTEYNGRPARVTAIRDITAHKEAQEALRRSEESLRLMLESAPIVLYATDASGVLTLSEGNGLAALGMKPGEAVGCSILAFCGGIPENEANIHRALTGEAVAWDAHTGSLCLHTELRPVFGADGVLSGLIGVCYDVTERKRAETRLAESQQRLALATESARIGIWDWDVAANKISWDAQICAMFGIGERDLCGGYDTWRDTLHPDDRDRMAGEIRAVLNDGTDLHTEFRVVWPDGEVRHIEAHAASQQADDGTALRMTGVNWDITARRRSEQELMRSEERFRVLFEQSSDAHLLVGAHGIIDCNPAAVAMLGLREKSELLARHPAVMSPEFQPDGRRSGEKSVEMDALAHTRGGHRFDWVLRKKSGDDFPVEVSLTPVIVEGQAVLLAVLHDLTERNRAEAALRAEQEKFQSLADGLGTGLLMTDLDDTIQYANPRMAEITGYAREEMIGQCAYRLLLPPDEGERMRHNNRERSTGVSGAYEIMFQRKDGSQGWLEVFAVPFRNAAGEIVGTVATNTDVTDRVRAEAALRESEAHLRLALESGSFGSYDMDRNTFQFLEVTDTYKAQFGLPPEADISPETAVLMVPPDDRTSVQEAVDRSVLEHTPWHAEHRLIWPDGSVHWSKVHGLPIYDAEGRAVRMIGITQDITDRKRAEEALTASHERLQESEARLRLALESGSFGSYDMDQATLQFLELSDTYKAQFGLLPDADVTPIDIFAMFHPDDAWYMTEAFDRANAERCGWQAEHRVVWPDGSVHWCKAHGLPIFDEVGRPARMIGVTQDITERKALEAERERLAERERTIASRLQAALQPPPEHVPGLQVGSLTQAALDEALVGGDFYDVFPLGNGRHALVIGDVSGKGLAAAVQLALIRNSLRTTLYLCPRPAEAATKLNAIVTAHNLLVGFVTAWIGVYDDATGRITYASCAHEPGLVRRTDGVEALETTGPPLGMDADAVYGERSVTLTSGDSLLLHTDGLPESGPSRRDMLGTDGMMRLMAGLPDGQDPQTQVATLVAEAAANAQGVFRDDVTVLLAHRE